MRGAAKQNGKWLRLNCVVSSGGLERHDTSMTRKAYGLKRVVLNGACLLEICLELSNNTELRFSPPSLRILETENLERLRFQRFWENNPEFEIWKEKVLPVENGPFRITRGMDRFPGVRSRFELLRRIVHM